MLDLNVNNIFVCVDRGAYENFGVQLAPAHRMLTEGTGAGSELTGWLRLPQRMLQSPELARIDAAAARIRSDSDALVVIGVGGSYLGARAAIELLCPPAQGGPDIYFVGTGFSPDDMGDVMQLLEGRDFSVNVVSKSGTTLEPAIAFRIFKNHLEQRYGKEGAARRIYATTDAVSGALRTAAQREGYESFVVPDDVGGRYSVLSAVGLLPMAVAGVDIRALLSGAQAAMAIYDRRDMSNPAWQYAAARNLLYQAGKKIELLAYFEPPFRFMSEWWKQLFAESEGKNGKGIFPASAQFSAELHSLGQYIQQGDKSLFETAIYFEQSRRSFDIPRDASDLDGLNYLAGRDLKFLQRQSALASLLAHADGGVPNMLLSAERVDETCIGELIYFFMVACAVSTYAQGLNPFDQPGVEEYKRNTFALLGRPGYEDLRRSIEARLKQNR